MTDKDTWAQRVRQRTSEAVRREDEARILAEEVSRHLGGSIACAGTDSVDVEDIVTALTELVESKKFRDLVKECLREVLNEAVKP